MEPLYLLQDKVVSKSQSGDIAGMLAVLLPDAEDDTLNWEGGKLHKRLWSMIKAFMKWSYDEHKCEAQVRLFYHVAKKVWAAVPLPQYVSTGLTTTEAKTHELRDKLLEKFPSDTWKEFGTVHHHCAVGAFQSGTDWNDETKCPGVHITLGYMDKPTFAIHCRCSFRGIIYDIDESQWLEEVDLSSPEVVDGAFPSHWKNSLVKRVLPSYTSSEWYKAYKQRQLGISTDDASIAGVGSAVGFQGGGYGSGLKSLYGYNTSDYDERLRRWRDSYGKSASELTADAQDVIAIERDDDALTSSVQYECILKEINDYLSVRPGTQDVIIETVIDSSLDLDDAEAIIAAIGNVYDGLDELMSQYVVDMTNVCRLVRAFIAETCYLSQESIDSTMMASILRDAGGMQSVKKPKKGGKKRKAKRKSAKKGKKVKTTQPELTVVAD